MSYKNSLIVVYGVKIELLRILFTNSIVIFLQTSRKLLGLRIFWSFTLGENLFGGRENIKDFYKVEDKQRVQVKRFKTEAVSCTIKFNNLEKSSFTITDILQDIIHNQLADVHENHHVGFEITSEFLERRLLVPFSQRKTMKADKILSLIERVQQSKENFTIDNSMKIKVVVVPVPN